jgi:hypothetical protein
MGSRSEKNQGNTAGELAPATYLFVRRELNHNKLSRGIASARPSKRDRACRALVEGVE